MAAALGTSIQKPKAILSVSAHWYIDDAAVTVSTAPIFSAGKIHNDFSEIS